MALQPWRVSLPRLSTRQRNRHRRTTPSSRAVLQRSRLQQVGHPFLATCQQEFPHMSSGRVTKTKGRSSQNGRASHAHSGRLPLPNQYQGKMEGTIQSLYIYVYIYIYEYSYIYIHTHRSALLRFDPMKGLGSSLRAVRKPGSWHPRRCPAPPAAENWRPPGHRSCTGRSVFLFFVWLCLVAFVCLFFWLVFFCFVLSLLLLFSGEKCLGLWLSGVSPLRKNLRSLEYPLNKEEKKQMTKPSPQNQKEKMAKP